MTIVWGGKLLNITTAAMAIIAAVTPIVIAGQLSRRKDLTAIVHTSALIGLRRRLLQHFAPL